MIYQKAINTKEKAPTLLKKAALKFNCFVIERARPRSSPEEEAPPAGRDADSNLRKNGRMIGLNAGNDAGSYAINRTTK